MNTSKDKTFKKIFTIVFVVGLSTLFAGLIYGCITVGTPRLDIPPEKVAGYVSNSKLSGYIMIAGVVMSFISSILMMAGYSIYKGIKKVIKISQRLFLKQYT